VLFGRILGKFRPIAIASPTGISSGWLESVGSGEFLEGKARNFGDDVIDSWFKGSWGFFGDVVGNFV
jgi:hypothetical protein